MICPVALEGEHVREQTKDKVASVIRHLRAGKTPKEIAFIMKIKWSQVQMIVYRHRQVRSAFIDTYSLRHPDKQGPPHKIILPLMNQAQS